MTPQLTEARIARIKNVARRRQEDVTVILENVHDPHNIGAVLRTCDSIGVSEVYVLYTEKKLQDRGLKIGHKSASGVKQWIDTHYFKHLEECFETVRSRYDRIYGTVLSEQSISLYDLDLTTSTALVFGNEHTGISTAAQAYLDGNFLIPQVGFAKSLNISVACAVSLYEVYRQRSKLGMYERSADLKDPYSRQLYDKYVAAHLDKKRKNR